MVEKLHTIGQDFSMDPNNKKEEKRIPAEIAENYQIGTLMGDGGAYDNENFINETAKLIGGANLDDGEIIRLWKTGGL